MDNKTIRLIYPQWQGGDIARWLPEIDDEALAARGYALGARLLDFLVPAAGMPTYEVPVSTAPAERCVTDGVLDLGAIVEQTAAALSLLNRVAPEKILTLGGECSTSVVPFTYLAEKYAGDVALVWIDAHPDITLPGDAYAGYHAMALSACMGLGAASVVGRLPARFGADRILLVGVRDWERPEIEQRQHALGLRHLAPAEVAADSRSVTAWLRACGASRVVIHFDLDVLDPAEITAGVGVVPSGLSMQAVARIIQDIARERELVGLTVAEAMPRTALRLRRMLEALPLFR